VIIDRKLKGFCAVMSVLLLAGVATRVEASTQPLWTTAAPVTFAAGLQSASPNDAGEDISCSSAGNCTAVGRFKNAAGGYVPFTLTSTSGTWAQAVPVVFASGVHHATFNDSLTNVSCSSAGNCTAVGRFKNAAGGVETFAVSSTNGTWAQAVPVVFAAGVQNSTARGELLSVDCVSAGNCTAVGLFTDAAGDVEAFAVSSTGGTWAQANPVGFAAGVQNTSHGDILRDVSCASAGNCTAVGQFKNAAGDFEAFTVSSTGGTWAQAVPVVFAAGVQNTSHGDILRDVSCASAGNCTAVGEFKNAAGDAEAFTVSSTGGTWAQAMRVVFGSGLQNANPNDSLVSVSCASAGNCTAGGYFQNSNSPSGQEAFSVTSTNGAWAQAVPVVFGAGVQSQSKFGNLRNISCMSAGNCTAVGHFENTSGYTEAFVTNMINGTWSLAVPVVFGAGVQASTPDATTDSVSCVSVGNCSVIGGFANLAGDYEVFVASSSYAPPAEIATTVAATTTTTIAKNTTSSKSGSLPSTGSKSNSGIAIALTLLFVGFGILVIRRREFQ
jgi:LPXTG-motif cell wall-anchored protein